MVNQHVKTTFDCITNDSNLGVTPPTTRWIGHYSNWGTNVFNEGGGDSLERNRFRYGVFPGISSYIRMKSYISVSPLQSGIHRTMYRNQEWIQRPLKAHTAAHLKP